MPLSLEHRKVGSFSPDLDPLTPGILGTSNDFYPTMQGIRTLPSLIAASDPLPERPLGAAALTMNNGLQFIVAGGNSTLNVLLPFTLSTAWHTTTIGPPASRKWRFAIYQDLVIATDGVDPPRYADATSLQLPVPVWTPLGTPVVAPNASIVAASSSSLFLIEPVSATWWSTVNAQLWTPAIETETVTATLDQTPGIITAAKAIRSNMVLFKEHAMHLGSLSGPPFFWQFPIVSAQVGTPVQEAVASLQDVLYFLGCDDFYSFDGFSISRIPNALKEWFFARTNEQLRGAVRTRVDTTRSLVFWHFISTTSPAVNILNEWICLNVRTGQWTNGTLELASTVDGPIQAADIVTSGVFKESDFVMYEYGVDGQRSADPGAFFTTGDIGDRHFMYQCTRVRPGFTIRNGTNTLIPQNAYNPGGPYTDAATVPLTPHGWFDFLNTSRLQHYKITADADCEFADYEVQTAQVGAR